MGGCFYLVAALQLSSLVICALADRQWSNANAEAVRILWGVADATATFGKLFQYRIPTDAFEGPVVRYEVTEAGFEMLPAWLSFDATKQELFGVPLASSDIGSHYVEIVAVGKPLNATHASFARDVFAIHVREETLQSMRMSQLFDGSGTGSDPDRVAKGQMEPVLDLKHCAEDTASMLTVHFPILIHHYTDKTGLDQFSQSQRRLLLQTAADALNAPLSALRLFDAHYLATVLSRDLISAAPADPRPPQPTNHNERQRLVLAFLIGCSGEHVIDDRLRAKLERIEQTVLTPGLLNKQFQAQYPDVDLLIESCQLVSVQMQPRRRRRQYNYATPLPRFTVTMSPSLYSVRPISSGQQQTPPATRIIALSRSHGSGSSRRPRPKIQSSLTHDPKQGSSSLEITPNTTTTAAPTMDNMFGIKASVRSKPSTSESSSHDFHSTVEYLPVRAFTKTLSTNTVTQTTSTAPAATATTVLPPELRLPTVSHVTSPMLAASKTKDMPPMLKTNIGSIQCQRGVVCTLELPEDMFVDAEDGNTSKLRLELRALSDIQLSTAVPLLAFLDTRTLTLTAFSMKSVTVEYSILASDSANQLATDSFLIDFADRQSPPFNHRFVATLSADYDQFTMNSSRPIAFLRRLAQFFRDPDARYVTVLDISRGSVVLSWANNSLASDRCDSSAIDDLRSRKFRKQSSSVRQEFAAFMAAGGFAIKRLEHVAETNCLSANSSFLPQPVPVSELGSGSVSGIVAPEPSRQNRTTGAPLSPAGPTEVYEAAEYEENRFVSTLLPICIIGVLLIIAAVVFGILYYRRNRKIKEAGFAAKHLQNGTGRYEVKSEFVSRGVPIILPDELDATGEEPSAHTPMLLNDEKPPASPLEFNGSFLRKITRQRDDTSSPPPPNHQEDSSTNQNRDDVIPLIPTANPDRNDSMDATRGTHSPSSARRNQKPPPGRSPAHPSMARSPQMKHSSFGPREPPPYVATTSA